MKIVHLTPGTGDTFYCQNCVRDMALVRALGRAGAQVTLAPMYLPLPEAGVRRAPVFYGAINVWLDQRFPRFGKHLRWLHRWLDALPLLELAGRRAGSTDAGGLAALTASMLEGEDGRQAAELDRLIDWLKEDGAPDVVHLSNALLLGTARRLRRDLGCAIVCTLQDEDVWVDAMPPADAAALWSLLADRARDADLFLAVSRDYADRVSGRLALAEDRLRVIHPGVEAAGPPSPLPHDPPVLGCYARMAEGLGLDTVVDAFLTLRRRTRFAGLRLRAGGGATARDRDYLRRLHERIERAGAAADAEFVEEFDPPGRFDFLRTLTIFSAPSTIEDAYGLNLVEAMAAGVPVLQPRRGAFPEIVAESGGGLIYEPATPDGLAAAAAALLDDPDRLRALAAAGREAARGPFSIGQTTAATLAAYAEAVRRRTSDNPSREVKP